VAWRSPTTPSLCYNMWCHTCGQGNTSEHLQGGLSNTLCCWLTGP
jgi:hypothetical protein